MKKGIALLLALALTLTLVCPAFALDKGELKLVVLGDSISAGTGLYAGEKAYRELVLEKFGGSLIRNLAQDGDECADVMRNIRNNPTSIQAANCFTLSVGSNDYIEYLADYMLGISTPEEGFFLDYDDMGEFFTDILVSRQSKMYEGILRFTEQYGQMKTLWKTGFCQSLRVGLDGILAQLHEINPNAPILLLNYYSPGDPFADAAAKAAPLLRNTCENIKSATSLMRELRSPESEKRGAQVALLQTKLLKLSLDIYGLMPILKEFGVDLTRLSPLVALAGMGVAGMEAMTQDTRLSDMLTDLSEIVTAIDRLIRFTGETMVQMNREVNELAQKYPQVRIIDVAELGREAENLSSIDHFHPSAAGQQIIADKMVEALESRSVDGPVIPPEKMSGYWRVASVASAAIFRWWLGQVFR